MIVVVVNPTQSVWNLQIYNDNNHRVCLSHPQVARPRHLRPPAICSATDCSLAGWRAIDYGETIAFPYQGTYLGPPNGLCTCPPGFAATAAEGASRALRAFTAPAAALCPASVSQTLTRRQAVTLWQTARATRGTAARTAGRARRLRRVSTR